MTTGARMDGPPGPGTPGTAGTAAARTRQTASRLLVPVFLVVLIDFIGFGLIIPLLPLWAKRLGASPSGVGLVLSAYALAQFLFAPVLGSLSDRYGRRPVILVLLLIEALGFALTALSGSLLALLGARFLAGLGASNIGSAQAVVADVTPAAGRARGMAMIGAAIGLGFVVGPALGGVLASRGLPVPFWTAMGFALVNVFLVARYLPETRRAGVTAFADRGITALRHGWRRVRGQAVIARLVAVNLLFTFAFSAMEAIFPLLTLRRFGWGAAQNGYLFTYIGILVVVMQGGLVGRLVTRWGERALLLAGLALLAVGLALLPISGTLGLLLLSLSLLSVGEGAVTPTVTALLSLASSSRTQGETLGLAQGMAGLGRILGPLAAGWLFASSTSAPFALGSALTLVALAILLLGPASRPLVQALARQHEKRVTVQRRKSTVTRSRRPPPGVR
jgi:multidrug resistance protein